MRRAALLVILAPALALGACTVRREAAAPPAYSQASPYAPGAYSQGAYSQGTYAAAPGQRVIAPAPGSYCEEAVDVAQDAAARAQASGSPRDAGRANRSASYAARDCR
jgi:hypothetical protein